jgi:hypothetical protein
VRHIIGPKSPDAIAACSYPEIACRVVRQYREGTIDGGSEHLIESIGQIMGIVFSRSELYNAGRGTDPELVLGIAINRDGNIVGRNVKREAVVVPFAL